MGLESSCWLLESRCCAPRCTSVHRHWVRGDDVDRPKACGVEMDVRDLVGVGSTEATFSTREQNDYISRFMHIEEGQRKFWSRPSSDYFIF